MFEEYLMFGLNIAEMAILLFGVLPLVGLVTLFNLPLHKLAFRDSKWVLMEREDHLSLNYENTATFATESEAKDVIRSLKAAEKSLHEYVKAK